MNGSCVGGNIERTKNIEEQYQEKQIHCSPIPNTPPPYLCLTRLKFFSEFILHGRLLEKAKNTSGVLFLGIKRNQKPVNNISLFIFD
jgi:hypothetical protein